MRDKVKLLITIGCSGISMLIFYVINFWSTRDVTSEIGVDAFGFITLAKNIISYANVISIALNSYATRFITVAYQKGDQKKASVYYNTVLFSNVILGSFILIVFSIFSFNVDFILKIPDSLVAQIKVLFLLTGLNFSLFTFGSTFCFAPYVKNELDKTYLFKALSYLLEALVIFGLFSLFNPKTWYVAIGSIVSTSVIFLSNVFLQKKLIPEFVVKRSDFSFGAVKELVGNGLWNSLNSLGNVLNSGLDLLISNLLLTSIGMGQIAVAKTIGSLFLTLIQLVSQPFQPLFLKSYSSDDENKLIKQLKISMAFTGAITNVALAGFFVYGKVFFMLWLPGQDYDVLWILTMITLIGSVFEGAVYPLYYIYTLKIKNRIPAIVTIIGGVINISSMVILIKYTNLDIYSVVVTTAVIMTIINSVINPVYMAHCLNEKWWLFYPNLLLHLLSLVVLLGSFYGLAILLKPTSWLTLILFSFILAILGFPIHLLITAGYSFKILKRKK